MSVSLRQSTASQEIPLGHFLDSADGDTEETGLTIANTDIKIWKNGAATLASKNSGGATHISNGVYYCTLDATDTDTVGPLVIFVHVSGALACKIVCDVLPANVYDAKYGADRLQVDVREKGDASLDFTTTEKASIGTAVQTELNTAVPGSPTTGSLFERIKALDDAYTAARAGFLDNINNAELLNITATILGRIDVAISTRSSHAAADIWSVVTRTLTDPNSYKADLTTLETRLSATRAGYLDNLSGGAVALEATLNALKGAGWTDENIKEIVDLLENATYGLSALRTRGDLAWITATGFSTHSAAAVWSVSTRALTDKANFTISGTKTTLDALTDISLATIEGSSVLAKEATVAARPTLAQIEASTVLAKASALATVDSNVDTILAYVTILKKIGVNKWAIVNSQLIFYDDDGITPLYTFDLDDDTDPTSRTPA